MFGKKIPKMFSQTKNKNLFFHFRSLPPELQGMLNQDLSNLNQGLSIGGPVNWRNIPGRNSQTRYCLLELI
jgi:hypothetical protein